MKQIFKVFAIAVATLAFVGCNKEIENQIAEGNGDIRKVDFSAGTATKTVFGTPSGTTIPTLWTENQKVGVSMNFATQKQSTTPVVSNAGATASFSVDIEAGEATTFKFYAVSPYPAFKGINSTYKSATIDISSDQTPLDNSVDEGAQVIIATHDAGSTFPTSSVAMNFSHLTAYGKVSFSNLSLASEEEIVAISLTADENWAGRYYYYFEDNGEQHEGDLVANSATKTITLTTNKSSNLWFACAPVDLGGKKIKAVITTNKGTTYTKAITVPAGKSFASGKVNVFTIDMSGVTPASAVAYQLVKSITDLTAGSEVVIAAFGDYNYAMSTTQNTGNRGSTAITKSADKSTIATPGAAVQLFTVVDGTKANTLAFSTGSGYIYAASSDKNYLKTEETLSDNSSWSISIASTGEATVVAQGTNTRNNMRYNASNNPPVFSCYASSSSVVTKVCFYKRVVADTRADSGISWSDDEGLGDLKESTLVLPTLNNPNSLPVTYSSSDPTVATVDENAHTVTLLKAGSTEIHAVFIGDATYKNADVFYTLNVDDTRAGVTLSFATPSYALTIGTSDYTSFTGQTVTSSPSVTGITYALTGATVGTLNASTGVISLNGTTTGDATITASFAGDATHKPAASVSYTIEVFAAGFSPFNVWEDDFSGCTDYVTLTSLSGSKTGFTGDYSGISATYAMIGAIRVGKASGAGSITTPVLTNIDGTSASLTITFKAAGWNGKNAKITLSASKGTVTEGQTTITSESTMAGTSPTMTGTTYTFHVTGADNTTAITFATTNSIGIDDLVIKQTAK